MNTNRSIKIKAFILLALLVFQTLGSFACSIDHLPLENKADQHKAHHHTHTLTTGMDNPHKQHQGAQQDCCKDASAHLVKADKLIGQMLTLPLLPIFLIHAPAAYSIAFLRDAPETAKPVYVLPDHHPPISDIRIAIQSFQI